MTTAAVYLAQWETTTLPPGDSRGLINGGRVRAIYTKVIGGWFDELGTTTAGEDQRELSHRGIATAATQSALETLIKSYEALRGDQGKLYRIWPASGNVESVTARVLEVSFESTPENVLHMAVNFRFVTDEAWANEAGGLP